MYRLVSGLVLSLLLTVTSLPSTGWTSPAAPIEGFVAANGVRLQYLDWGHNGPALILVHGLGDNPHKFDDLAPAFTDRFHVIAYARRGAGGSEARGPYDVETLSEDLRSLMDALGIAKADFAGQSAGGNEITELAVRYPQRVRRIVYLDAGYDWADPDFKAACDAVPFTAFNLPSNAMSSWDAYRTYQKAVWYPQLDDMRRIEANLRENIVVQPDRSVKDRIPKEVLDAHVGALFANKSRDYARIHVPVLAIYTQHMYDPRTTDLRLRNNARAWEQKYWIPFQEKSMARVRNELEGVEIVRIPGVHGSFILTDRERVVEAMRRFLEASK
jgi:pimeloyl-ACP methyl ester carboxylesterase